jgi:hypothetical protein
MNSPLPTSVILFSAYIAPMLRYIFSIPSLPELRSLLVGIVTLRMTMWYLQNANAMKSLMLAVFRDLMRDRTLRRKLLLLSENHN